MAINFTPADIQSGYQSTETLDANFESLEELLVDALSRTGEAPNGMEADLDMQGNRIYNLPSAVANGEPVTYGQWTASRTPLEFAGYLIESQTATSAQKVFTLSNHYTPGLGALRVFVNGLYISPDEYTESATNEVTFGVGRTLNDEVVFVITSFEEADYDTAATVQYQNSDGTYSSVQDAIDNFAFQSDISHTVGATGDFATINAALEYLSWWYPANSDEPIRCTLELETGFQMEEQVVVYGRNFGWVTITSVDPEVTIVRSALTMGANDYNFAVNANLDSAHCAFLGHNGAVLPRIGCLFTMDTSGSTARDYTGILVNNSSSVTILEGCGVKNVVKPAPSQSGRGLNVAHGSFATGWGSVWDGCEIGVRVSNASHASVRECSAVGCDYAIDVNGASFVGCQDSDLSGCTYHSVWASGVANVKALGCDCTGTGTGGTTSAYAAILAETGAIIDASTSDVSGSGRGVHAENAALVYFGDGVCNDTKGNGLTARLGSRIIAPGVTVSGTLAGEAVVCNSGAYIDVSNGDIINNTAVSGLSASGGKIIAYNAVISGNKLTGADKDIIISDGGEVYAYNADTTNGTSAVAVADTNVTRLNDRTSAGVIWTSGESILNGSKTHNFGSLADGAGETTTVTVTGAALGDFVEGVSLSVDLQGMILTGYVSAADTVTVRLQNETGSGPIDVDSGTLRVRVRKA